MNLNKFAQSTNLHATSLDFFVNDLNIKINPFDSKPIAVSDFFKDEKKVATLAVQNIDKLYVIGLVDDNTLNNQQSQLQTVLDAKTITQDYPGLVLCAIQLKNTPTRAQLAELTRLVNRAFPYLPVTIIFKYDDKLTFANAERAKYLQTWREGEKIGKISMLKDIDLINTHGAHLKILNDLKVSNSIETFDALYQYWQKVLNTKELNKKFFKKIANWYFWSVAKSKFPYEYLKDDAKHKDKTNAELQNLANQKATIRFITRMIFVWFLKEKKLVPSNLFDKDYIKTIIKDFDTKNSSNYYNAILQNLFFATLNRKNTLRDFALDKSFKENQSTYDMNSFFRYENLFLDKNPATIMQRFEKIPFINGGLFDCLDIKPDKKETIEAEIIDGFSRKRAWQATMPDYLFFENNNVDFDNELLTIYDTKKGTYEVKGLFTIFEEYKFTVEENTPLEVDVALDPYLLGEIFENLLAYYNPETGVIARKGSGSFYTPQEIVNYMVDESLLAYLKPFLPILENFQNLQDISEAEKSQLVKALAEVKILDPACGSGAFPMGVLYKMVDILKTIDPNNSIWKQVQHDKIIGDEIKKLEADAKIIENLSDDEVRNKAQKAVEDKLNELENNFNNKFHFDDYTRKLYIIRNSIYGVDIQDVAIQISKLRFFLSLIIDQKNENIEPLPNLETKFVIANTLIGIELPKFTIMGEEDHSQDQVKQLKEELKAIREKHFYVTDRKQKQLLKKQDEAKRKEIANALADSLNNFKQSDIEKLDAEIATQQRYLAEADQMPDMVQEIIVKDLFGGESTSKVNYRKERIKECNTQIRLIETKKASLQTNTQAEIIRTQALKIADWDIYNQNAQAEWFDSDWMFGINDGFDIVIGNPPYVQLQKDGGKLANLYTNKGFKTFERTGDIYSLFYEKGINLLKFKGTLNFITSNKWMRAGYGKSLRKFFCENNPLKLIDLGSDVFETATVDTNILIIQNCENQNKTFAIDVSKNKNVFETLNDYSKWLNSNDFNENSWSILDNNNSSLKLKIEKNGKAIKDWNVKINRGITTGFNEAFIIDDETKKDICKQNNNSIDIIKPVLRGKDINKYYSNWSYYWLIESHNGYKNSNNIKTNFIDVRKFPSVLKHLKKYDKQLNARGDKGITIYNLRNCAYQLEFNKEKVVWQRITQEPTFCLSNENEFLLDSMAFIITNNNNLNRYFLSILNSKLIYYLVKTFVHQYGETGFRLSNQYVEQLPIKEISLPAQEPFINLVNQILEGKKQGNDTSSLEHEIDVMVYHLYELSYDEALVIDGSLSKEDFERFVIS